jgi:hypothetical protein
MPSFKGQRNIYVCDSCHGHIVTVDLEDGTTPFAIPCKATLKCTGMMKSSMYRVYDQSMAADHEWFKPTEKEVRKMSLSSQEHWRLGGLFLRRVES